ncbi:MAG TPA: alpha/beta fold hydrolase [Polyangiales bacterium]|nr:alpha/beta fold hydrolase [Polyangiales bacterium]
MGRGVEQTLAVLNGLLGDYLARTKNGLATEMGLFRDEHAVPLEPASFTRAYPNPSGRVCVLVHGLMCTETIWRLPDGSDYGSLLERDLGWTACYVRYNTGVPIADNGAQLARLLERLLAVYPREVEELLLIGYSMGGLVTRSACHVASIAGMGWLGRVKRIIYVATPHLGAPAERLGKLTAGVLTAIRDPYTQLIADVANLRSGGLQDLGHADLRHEDRVQQRSVWMLRDGRHPLPLLPNIQHTLIAGSLAVDPRLAFLFGDSLVSVVSGTFANQADEVRELLPAERVKVLPGLSHVALAHHPAVYELIKSTLESAP